MTACAIYEMRLYSRVYNIYYDETLASCTEQDIPPPQLLPQRRPPTRITGPSTAYKASTEVEYYRVHLYQLVDSAVNALQRRYDQPGVKQYVHLESVILTQRTIQEISDIVRPYPELNSDRLILQLQMFRDQN